MCKAITLIILCTGIFTALPVSAEEAAGGERQAAPKVKMTSIKGEITEVDTAANMVKVKEGKNESEIMIDVTDKTVITAGKVKRTFADLKTGDKIVAKFTEEDGRNVARSIRVATLGKGGAKRQPASETEPPGEASVTEAPETEAPGR